MSEATRESTGPEPIWTAVLDQNVSQPPIILGNTLLVATQPSGPVIQHSRLQAIDLADGNLKWQKEFEYSLVSGMEIHQPIGRKQAVAVVATSSTDFLHGDGFVQAYDEAGEVAWRWQSKEQNYSAPFVKDRQIYVIADSKILVGFCPEEDGCSEQRIPLDVKPSISALAVYNGVAYIPCRSPDLLAVGLDGDVRWHFQFQGGNLEWLDKTPVISGGFLYSVSSLGFIYCLELETGKLAWQAAVAEGRPLSPPVIEKENIYIGTRYGVEAIDKNNGRSNWTFSATRPVSARPLVYGGMVFATSEDHFLYVLDAKNGKEQWRYELERRIEEPPILSPSALIIADRGGNIAAFEPPVPVVVEEDEQKPQEDPAVVRAFRKQTAEKFEQEYKHVEAAQIWHELGDLERAAEQYELAESWSEAAGIWLKLDRFGKRAQALRKYARELSMNEEVADEDKAEAWEQVADAFAETGDKESRTRSERQVARFRHQPILTLEIEPSGTMIAGSWTKLNYTLKNEGFGVARHVDVTVRDDRFEAQRARTQTIVTLQPEDTHSHFIDVNPRSHGPSVPLQLVVEFMDKVGRIYMTEKTFRLPVTPGTAALGVPTWAQTGGMGVGDSTGQLAELPVPEGVNLPELREKIIEYFSMEELAEVIFDLGLVKDQFTGGDGGLPSVALKLITALTRHGRIMELIEILQKERPHVEWTKKE